MADLQEYVIKLGAQVDNPGIQKVFSILTSGKMKAAGIAGALTAATTAVYKFVESATKQELELQKLAEKQKKTVEATRASETALKQMGMTLKEIEKDKSLKKIYDDLVKFNSALALPDMKGAIANVNGLRSAFWKLRGAAQYVAQWVNARFLANMAAPISRITEGLNKISEWVRLNLSTITTKIAQVMTGFSKGMVGIFETVAKIFEYVGKLPDGIKQIGSAIGIVFALLKSGPIGQILAAVTAVGDLIHDFENYKYNKANGFEQGQEGYIENLNDLLGIWDAIDNENASGMEKFNTIGVMLINAITEGIMGIPVDQLGTQVGNLINGIFTKITEAISPSQTS